MRNALVYRAGVCFTVLTALSLGAFFTTPARAQKQPAVDGAFFDKQVLPILQANCFKCHGSEAKIKGGLRLTSREDILKGGDSGPAVLLDKPETSRLLQAIRYQDGLEMPPKGKLADKEVAELTRWVTEKIPWGTVVVKSAAPTASPVAGKVTPESRAFWAYQPVHRPPTPAVKQGTWVRNPIDAFILARLEAKGLSPVGPADRVAWLRRVTYDLIGLPPTPEETAAFLADTSPKADERLVDRLLDSPHYGEKWGRHWLDLVRYAETNGYERDNAKPFAWRYRDYVINAFNKDKPYDQFLREQLAGDLLPHATPETWIATGYYRLGIWDDEPADPLQARYDVLDGIVSTTSQVVLGMSVGCARCHDHKRDPIPQRDYYRLLAFFQDVTNMNTKNTHFIASDEDRRAYEKNVREHRAREAETAEALQRLARQFTQALGEKEPGRHFSSVDLSADGESVLLTDARKTKSDWSYKFTRPAADWFQPEFNAEKWRRGPGGFGTIGTPGAIVGTVWNGKDIWLRRTFDLKELPTRLALDLHHDDDVEVYLNGVQVYQAMGFKTKYVRLPLEQAACNALKVGSNVLAIHCRQETGGQYVDAGLVALPSTMLLVDLVRRDGPAVWGPEKTQTYLALHRKLRDLRKQVLIEPGIEIMCVEERGQAPTYVAIRGSAAAQGERVNCGFPEVLVPPSIVVPEVPPAKKRLQLADWLTQPSNPMTARALVNRLWHYHFGRGIVGTPNDFGKLGEMPTHPELLDWLADEFTHGGWKIKRLQKMIMLSHTYRMSSQANADGLRLDPGNMLFWRFPMRRLNAEEVRDSFLAVSGELNLKAGGLSVYPPISKEVLAGQSVPGQGWTTSSPEESRRRSVYVHVKRSLQLPILAIHDQADTDSSCPVRYTTTVPTQALGMINGAFTNEQAAALAARIEREAADPAGRIRRAILLTTCRQATDDEVKKDLSFIEELRTQGGMTAADAWRYYCLVQLNSNEFLYLD
ncbi:MAG TPA: PSD1 and planctomycete cytochrome C domain-containing protein [Gemmataceae bacterium]|jgi:hypothetical protein|nr:PSD1 and planctomycete cytochrome C domain-containing protein [Gemmataceae bacterium]